MIDFTNASQALSPKEKVKVSAAFVLKNQGELKAAKYLVQILFASMVDKAGEAYFNHLERVASGITDDKIKPIGWLHDTIEDIEGWTAQDLLDIGFSNYVVDGVKALSRKSGDPYFDEMVVVGMTPQALPVKRSDLRDNSNLLRLGRLPDEWDIKRTKKYALAYMYLGDVETGKTKPGTPFGQWMAAQPENRQDWDLFKEYSSEKRPANLPVHSI